MKRYGGLFVKICTIENFKLAYERATKGKKKYKEVIEIEKYGVDKFLEELLYEFKTHVYKTSKYDIFKRITGGKEREIYRLPMRDRIVQHAIMNYIEPIFRKSFIFDTYASIKGRGIHLGLKQVNKALKRDPKGTLYCLKLDIKKFYPSIDKDLLKLSIRKKFKDKDLLISLDEIIDSCPKGVPIGNYTSQYFANYFLTRFDHKIKEYYKVSYYFRYCDDIVTLHSSKEFLRNLLKIIIEELSALNLSLKPNYQIFPVNSRGVNFLGYVSYHTHILVRKHIKQSFIKKMNKVNIKQISSYWGIFCHANCINLWRKYTNANNFKEFKLQWK